MLKQGLAKGFLPYLVIFSGLFLAGIVSSLVSGTEINKTTFQENNIKGATNTVTKVDPTPELTPITKPAVKAIASPTPSHAPEVSTPTPTPSSNPETVLTISPTPVPMQYPQLSQVGVSINDSASFSVSVHKEANQCGVLNQALEDGKISSLNMRYDSSLNSFAVYQINGIGKENSVWWTYTVNGQFPGQGCSYIKAKNNDNVEWKYIGS